MVAQEPRLCAYGMLVAAPLNGERVPCHMLHQVDGVLERIVGIGDYDFNGFFRFVGVATSPISFSYQSVFDPLLYSSIFQQMLAATNGGLIGHGHWPVENATDGYDGVAQDGF